MNKWAYDDNDGQNLTENGCEGFNYKSSNFLTGMIISFWNRCLRININFFSPRSFQDASQFSSVQSVSQSCPMLCDPVNRSTPGLPVHHQLPEFTRTHVHRVNDTIQPSHPLSSPSPPAPNLSQHQADLK